MPTSEAGPAPAVSTRPPSAPARDRASVSSSVRAPAAPVVPAAPRKAGAAGARAETWGICTQRAGRLWRARSGLFQRRLLQIIHHSSALFFFICEILFESYQIFTIFKTNAQVCLKIQRKFANFHARQQSFHILVKCHSCEYFQNI